MKSEKTIENTSKNKGGEKMKTLNTHTNLFYARALKHQSKLIKVNLSLQRENQELKKLLKASYNIIKAKGGK